jgi:Tol biopolymer transport system component
MPIKPGPIFKVIISITLSALSAAPATIAHAPPPLRLITREVSLGRLHPGEVKYSRVISSDHKHLAFTVKTPAGEFVMVDGVAGKTYTSIPRHPLTEAGVTEQIKFSPDGRRVAYVARRGNKFLVVADSKEGPAYDEIRVGAPTFSADSRRLAYFAERGGKTLAVIDGIESKPFDDASSEAPIFSPDSRHVVYTAEHGKQTHVVLDGVETVYPEYVGEPEFSKTGKRMAYVVVRQDMWQVVIDGKEGKAYRGMGNNIEFSEDEKHVLYRADVDDGQTIVVDGIEMKPRPFIEENSYGFSPDGLRIAFVAGESRDIRYAVVDNQIGKAYQHVGKPAFSPDSKHVAYATVRAGKLMVVTDGVEGEDFDEVNDYFQFSADGKRMAYVAKREGKEFLVVNGVATAYDEIIGFKFSADSKQLFVRARRGKTMMSLLEGGEPKEEAANSVESKNDFQMAFSPDSQHTAWVSQRGGKSFVVSDGAAGNLYDEIRDLQFTSDSKHLVYAARTNGKVAMVVDGIESKWYDDFVSESSFVIDGRTIVMMVMRGEEVLRVEIEIL